MKRTTFAFCKEKMLVMSATLLSLTVLSCSLFSSEKITDYLNNQTNDVEIVELEKPGNYDLDKEGVISVPSDEDCTLTYVIKNPQGLHIDTTVTNVSDGTSSLSSLTAPYTFEVTDDNNYVKVTLTKEMLHLMEMGGNVSPIIAIAAQNYDLDIDPFTESIRANSPPPPVQGACVMIDTSYARSQTSSHVASRGRYVLCFNLPDSLFDADDIYCDTSRIYATGVSTSFTKGVSLGIDTSAGTWNTSLLPSSYSTGLTKNTYNGTAAVTFSVGDHPVYLATSAYATEDDNRNFVITLEDKKGLKSTVEVNTQAVQLEPVTANVERADSHIAVSNTDDDDETNDTYAVSLVSDSEATASFYQLVLTAPTKTSGTVVTAVDGVSILYKIYSCDYAGNKSLLELGNVVDTASYKLPEGSYYVTAYAHKDGYVDSIRRIWNITVGNRLPVVVEIETQSRTDCTMYITPSVVSSYSLKNNNLITLVVELRDKNGTIISDPQLSNFTMALGVNGTNYSTTTDASARTLTLPDYLAPDLYRVTVQFKYNNCFCSGTFPLAVLE